MYFKNTYLQILDTRQDLYIMGSVLVFQVIQLSEATKCSNMGYACTSIYDTGQQFHQLYKKYSNSIDCYITAINPNLLNTVHDWTI
jgi:hypothetical protein